MSDLNEQDEPLTVEEEYALNMVVGYAESGVEDDIDEDGDLADEEQHREACDLAMAIIRAIRENPGKLLEMAHAEIAE